jgi:hypothetical protein
MTSGAWADGHMLDLLTKISFLISAFEKLGFEVYNIAQTPKIAHRRIYRLWRYFLFGNRRGSLP